MLASTRRALGRSATAVLDLVLPPRCVACGKEGVFLCSACADDAPGLPSPHCRRCAVPVGEAGLCERCAGTSSPLAGVVSAFAMEGAPRRAVHALKYERVRALAPVMAWQMAASLPAELQSADLVVPVPLHPKRLRERGYNQAELLARQIGRLLGLPMEPHAITRVRSGPPQARSTSRESRRENMARAFSAGQTLDAGTVLLVDDVCTTGATLEACAAALLEGGVTAAWGVTFVRET